MRNVRFATKALAALALLVLLGGCARQLGSLLPKGTPAGSDAGAPDSTVADGSHTVTSPPSEPLKPPPIPAVEFSGISE